MFQMRLRTILIGLFTLLILTGMSVTMFFSQKMQTLDQQIIATKHIEDQIDALVSRFDARAEQLNVLLNAMSINNLLRQPVDPSDPEQVALLEAEMTDLRLMDPDIVSIHMIQVYDQARNNVFLSGEGQHICFCNYDFFNLNAINRQPVLQVIAEPKRIAWSPVLSPFYYHEKPQLSILRQQPSDSFTISKVIQPPGAADYQYVLQMEIRSSVLEKALVQNEEIVDWVVTDASGNKVFHNPNRIGVAAQKMTGTETGVITVQDEKRFYRTHILHANGWKVTAFYKVVPTMADGMTRWLVLGIPLLLVAGMLIALIAWLIRRLVTRPFEQLQYGAVSTQSTSRIMEFSHLQSCMAERERVERLYDEKLKDQGKQTVAMKDLFDYVGLGIVTFYQDLIIHHDHSAEATYVYRGPFVSRDFVETTFTEDRTFLYTLFKEVFQQTNVDQRNLYLSLLPTETSLAGHIYELTYKMITKDHMQACMVIFTNVTAERELAEQLDHEAKTMKMIVKAVQSRNDVLQMIDSYRRFALTETAVRLESGMDVFDLFDIFYRQIHTFKGNFAQLYFVSIVSFLHELEDRLNRLADGDFAMEELSQLLEPTELLGGLAADEQTLRQVLGDAFFYTPASALIDETKIESLEKQMLELVHGSIASDVRMAFRQLRAKPIRSMLESYQVYTSDLGSSLEKQIAPLTIEGGYFTVDPNRYGPFVQSLVHVFRNMVDHGIESPDGRLEAGKPEFGHISCLIQEQDEFVELVIADDGKGIDRNAVIHKAVQKGLLDVSTIDRVTDQQVTQLIFVDDLSTKNEVTKISGRGVGMGAVRQEVLLLGGSVDCTFEEGRGTQFRFILPKSDESFASEKGEISFKKERYSQMNRDSIE